MNTSRIGEFCVVATVLSFGLLAALSVDAQAKSLTCEPHVFKPHNAPATDAETCYFQVPENRLSADSKTLKLAFVRFASSAENPGTPIVYLAGGPGVSGIETGRRARFQFLMALRSVGDVILLDQRGTGQSERNLRCPQKLGYPLDQPSDREELVRLYVQRSRECADSLRSRGVDLAGYNTVQSAADLDDLRKAIGSQRLSLVGTSYGTHLALAAMRQFPDSFDRVALFGVEPLDATLKMPRATETVLTKIAEQYEEAGRGADANELVALMQSVWERLDEDPIVVEVKQRGQAEPVKVTLGRFDLKLVTASIHLGSTAAQLMPRLYSSLAEGRLDYTNLWAGWVVSVRTGSIGSAMPRLMDCASGVSAGRLRVVEAEARGTALGRLVDFPFPEICGGWDAPDLGESFRRPFESNLPVLLVSGTLDGRTPPANAERVGSGFPNSSHLIIENAVHGDPLFLANPGILEKTITFLKGGAVSDERLIGRPLDFATEE